MSWSDLAGDTVAVSPSELESGRFGLSVARVIVGDRWGGSVGDLAALSAVLSQQTAELLVIRWPSRIAEIPAIVADSGRVVLPAEVLMYWGAKPSTVSIPTPDPAFEVRIGLAAEDEPSVLEVIRDSFAGYVNHYSVNPLLNTAMTRAGYLDWAARTLRMHGEHCVGLLRDGLWVGAATCRSEQQVLEIELAGLVATAQGRGVYGRLLGAAAEHARDRGLGRLVISTQAHNVKVQRAWSRAGLLPFGAFTTVHAVSRDTWERP